MKPEYKKKAIRSYVIRAGRITDSQKKAFDQYWPLFGLSMQQGVVDIDSEFPEAKGPLVVEIGYGMGESLVEMAAKEKDTRFIGIEVHSPGVGRLMAEAARLDLKNIKTYMADAIDILNECLPDDSIDRMQLFFPDPWHKKKHNKRRIVNDKFLSLVNRKLKIHGVFHMATDWKEYAEEAMATLCKHEGFENIDHEYCFSPRPEHRPITKFERRGEKLGHGVWDLMFRRKS